MNKSVSHFFVRVDGVTGVCPAGERWAKESSDRKAIPVLACEGPCIRGEIARLAGNILAKEEPYRRACYAEVALVPHSSMAHWVKSAERVVMIDGCFLRCIGRVLDNLVDKSKVIHIDAHRLHKKYSDIFSMEDVPEPERMETARQVAEKLPALLPKRGGERPAPVAKTKR